MVHRIDPIDPFSLMYHCSVQRQVESIDVSLASRVDGI